jgi:hypothetical protein
MDRKKQKNAWINNYYEQFFSDKKDSAILPRERTRHDPGTTGPGLTSPATGSGKTGFHPPLVRRELAE